MKFTYNFLIPSKCDKATPSCSQCVRAHRTCPGYRNQLDLMFRIQNDDIIEKSKAKAREKAAKAKAKERAAPVQLMVADGEIEETALEDAVILFSRRHLEFPGPWVLDIPAYTLTPTIEQRARGWFQTHQDQWLRNTDILESLTSQTKGDEQLLASMYAVGLASFSNHIHSAELTARARKGYVTALRLTNAALRSPTDAKKDSTLFAIMILGIYETVAGTNAQSVLAWTSHVNGAAALIEYRGVEQFNSEAGQRLFYQVISNLMISCIQRTIAMPQRIIDLRNAASHIAITPRPIWHVSDMIINFTSFRADVRECRLTHPREIIEKALQLDQRFADTFANPPEDWTYEVIFTDEDPHLVWNRAYHIFKHSWVAPVWNGMRTCRIMLHETIRDQLLSSASAISPVFTPAEADAQETSSVSICIEMGRDVMRSVPKPRSSINLNEPKAMLAGTHHAYILWPLYLVGGMDVASERVKDWVINRLKIMSEEEGIKQAGVVAGYLEQSTDFFSRRPDLAPWMGPLSRQWEGDNRVTDLYDADD